MTGTGRSAAKSQPDPTQSEQGDELLKQFAKGEASIPSAEEFLDQVLETKDGAAHLESEHES